MAFLDNLTNQATPQEAAVTSGVAILTLSGGFTDLERRLISIFRDEFPLLSRLQEVVFAQLVERAIDLVQKQGAAADVHGFVQRYIAPAIPHPQDRIATYRYAYALAMANLNVDSGEQALLDALKSDLSLDPAACEQAEAASQAEFAALHSALAATALGFIVVAADGVVQQSELDNVKAARNLFAPIARLDDTQFALIYDLGVSIYNRFLTDPNNRRVFLYQILIPYFNTPELRTQAFHYAASICTSDGDIARAEIDTLKDVLTALQLDDATGEQIFSSYMANVKTIDGKPNPPPQ